METVGRNSTTGTLQEGHPEVTIGNFTHIGPGTRFWGTVNYPCVNHPRLVANVSFNNHLGVNSYEDMGNKGPIHIGNDVWIGDNCDILSGVTIGDGAIIGLRTVVARDIPPYAVAVGNPVEIKKFRFSFEAIYKLLQIRWWEWPDQKIEENMKDFLDIDKFIEKYG